MTFLLLDFDGTLVDSSEDITMAINQLLSQYDRPHLSVKEVLRYVGDGAGQLVQAVLPDQDQEAHQQALTWFRDYYREHPVDQTRFYPGMEEVIDYLPTERIAIVTNKPEDITLEILDRLGRANSFAAVIGTRKGRPRKPDPAPLLEAMAIMDADPAQTALAGDGVQDMLAAQAAGCLPLGVAWGFHGTRTLKVNGAAEIIEKPAQLIDWWKKKANEHEN